MNFKIILLFMATVAIQVPHSEPANILALFTSMSKSHIIIHMSVANALIEQGHNVTVVTTLDIEQSDRFRHIKLPATDFRSTMAAMVAMSKWEMLQNFIPFINKMIGYSVEPLQSPEMQKLMDEETFDLLLHGYFFNEYEIGVAAHFKCPIVLSWMSAPYYAINSLIGNPDEINTVPNIMLGIPNDMGFGARVLNYLGNVVERFFMWVLRRSYNYHYEQLFPAGKYPSFDETKKNISLLLVNSHFSQGSIRPNVPAVVEIGGIQIDDEPKPLPQDIQAFLDSAGKDGAIFFSLGSNVHSADLGPDTVKTMYKVLSSLKQKILWKWESGAVPGNASNIKFQKWLPQNSVLAHPNLKLFITHGGKGSVVESQFYGVPMLGLPIFADQPANMKKVVEDQQGLMLDYKILSEPKLKETILELLENPKYTETVQQFKSLFRDRPMTAKQTATYWIEYVLRHKGAKHMQSPAVNMADYQVLGLDLMAFLAFIAFVWLMATKLMFRLMFKICSCCRRTKSSPEKAVKAKKPKSKKL